MKLVHIEVPGPGCAGRKAKCGLTWKVTGKEVPTCSTQMKLVTCEECKREEVKA